MDDNSAHQNSRLKKIIFLSLFVLLLSLTFNAFSLVIIYIHQSFNHKGYGEANLTANTIASVVFFLFAPLILRKSSLTSVQWLTICAICYLINVLVPALLSSNETRSSKSEVPPPTVFRTILEILANIIGGSASCILWVLYGLYMVEFCCGVDPQKKGYYFGVSTAIINLRSILGPILTIFGLGLGN